MVCMLLCAPLPLVAQEDPEGSEDLKLPSKMHDEFRPFVRKVPEFKFWCVLLAGFACLPRFVALASMLSFC